jgi:hypothetical protein
MKRRTDIIQACPACQKVRVMMETIEGDFSLILCISCMKKVAEDIKK